jgi:CIC family chloride channel protein
MSVSQAQDGASRGGDFARNHRLMRLSAFALLIGVISSGGAILLLGAIRLFTNVFFFRTLSLAQRSAADNHLGAYVIFIPLLGGLLVGLLALYGSEKIRGHGIPEAIESILFGKSRMSPKIAILKPLSSGIAIGSGGAQVIADRRGLRRHDRRIRHPPCGRVAGG